MQRMQQVGTTLWTHKKKTLFAAAVTTYGLGALRQRIKDGETRQRYALQAREFGSRTIQPTQRLRRVCVLVNREANGRGAFSQFSKNALPLLNLAGLEVNVIEVKSESEMESVARALDAQEADCIYVVGGDGTVCRVLSGVLCDKKGPATARERLPIGLFPGGRRNHTFHKIFALQDTGGVQLCCESAMALIEDTQRTVYPAKCTIGQRKGVLRCRASISSQLSVQSKQQGYATAPTCSSDAELPELEVPPKQFWLLSELSAGWFEHCEQREPKLWYWGPLKRRLNCFWEFLKRAPEPLSLQIAYEQFCPGCARCATAKSSNGGGLLGWLFSLVWRPTLNGSQNPSAAAPLAENPNCGRKDELEAKGAHVRTEVHQTKDGCKLRVLVVGERMARQEAMRVGWSGVEAALDEQRDRGPFSAGVDVEARSVSLSFREMPPAIARLAVSGDWRDLDDYALKTVTLETSREPLRVFVPRTQRQ